jgi:hypothetical protein
MCIEVVGYVVGFGDSIKENNIFSVGATVEKSFCACWGIVLVQEVICNSCDMC